MAERTTFNALLHTFTTFLTVAIHTILYERHLYPQTTFLTTKKYNYPVRQSRHPRVCTWITDAVASVEAQLRLSAVERVCVVIFDARDRPLERYVFDTSCFPVVPVSEANTPLERLDDSGGRVAVLPAGDVEEQLRAAMGRLSGCGERMGTLPEGCTFTIAVELKGASEPPLGQPQGWIPAEPGLQRRYVNDDDGKRMEEGEQVGGVRTMPVRKVAAGELTFEVWIEEGREKVEGQQGSGSTDEG